jgi:protein-disulfide isomerase
MDNEPTSKPLSTWLSPVVIAIMFSAWIIGMSILGAGYMISKEVSKSNTAIVDENTPVGPINIEVPAGLPVLGDNNAKVTVIEFADFQCPYCGDWQKTIFPKLKSEYIDTGKIRFVFMDFAFLGEESNKAAEAAKCAADQNRFWDYHDKLYASQKGENEGAFSDSNLKVYAKELQLNTSEFNSCFDARIHKAIVEEGFNKGSGYGVTSTPTVYINGIQALGLLTYENYKQIIEAELSK